MCLVQSVYDTLTAFLNSYNPPPPPLTSHAKESKHSQRVNTEQCQAVGEADHMLHDRHGYGRDPHQH